MNPAITPGAVPIIELKGISKRFGMVWANRDISLCVSHGEIHAVVGENGAGKSTLMGILYGHMMPDSGKMYLRGVPVRFESPLSAMQAGLGMVHQQPLIFPQLTALENITAGSGNGGWRPGAGKKAETKAGGLCMAFGFDINLQTMAGDLSFARRQQVELLRSLYRDAEILIMDEPTSLLAPPEVERFLALLKSLRSNGRTIILVSHRLREVFAVANRVSILRKGKLIGTIPTRDTTIEEVSKMIVGRSSDSSTAGGSTISGYASANQGRRPCLELDGVNASALGQESSIREISVKVHPGEILGIGGVVGNGQRTLAGTLSGAVPVGLGRILFRGEDITRHSLAERRVMGMRWLPANSGEEALLPRRTIWENLLLGRQRRPDFQNHGWFRKKVIMRWVKRQIEAADIVTEGARAPVESLSGGNQQKLALARILGDTPLLAVLEQAGRGLDIGAQESLRKRIDNLCTSGTAFIVFSHDLDELLSMCHRIGILYRGALMGVMDRDSVSREVLGKWMLGTGGN